MNSSKSTITTVVNALRYSFAFCWRNNKHDTRREFILIAEVAILGYFIVWSTGSLITAIQTHLVSPNHATFTLSDFIQGGYLRPAIMYIFAKYTLVIAQKLQSAISRQRGHVLRNAQSIEVSALKATLDVGRFHSEAFDNLRRRINDLPLGWNTRIDFAKSFMEILADAAALTIFGITLAHAHVGYFILIVVACIPMVIAEFNAANANWELTQELQPLNKKRSVFEAAFHGHIAFLQGLMFNQMPSLLRAIRANYSEIEGRYRSLHERSVQKTLTAQLISVTALCIVFVHAIWSTLSTGGDIGLLTILIASSDRLVGNIRGVIKQFASQWISANGVIMIEKEYFGAKPLVVTDDPVTPEFAQSPVVRFERICAAYPNTDVLVLKDISFEILPGEKVVIVGRNGSGKSTLLWVLLRFMDPHSGDVTIGGIKLRQILPATWYRFISALMQRVEIHDRRIGEEIASSDLDAPIDMSKVERAARFAEFMSVVEGRPEGFNTPLGVEHGGDGLSGGEERRLSIARLHYRDSLVTIFDEPEANLDPEAAHVILERIFGLKNRTVIVVTQRVVEAARADRILVMRKGELVGNGTHIELMESCPYYRTLFERDAEDRRRRNVDSIE